MLRFRVKLYEEGEISVARKEDYPGKQERKADPK